MGLGVSKLNPGSVRSLFRVYPGGLHMVYCGCIWGLSGVSGPINSKSCERLVAFSHPVDSSPDTPPPIHRIHPNTPRYTNGYTNVYTNIYTNGYTEVACPDTPCIHTLHAPQIDHSYYILGYVGASSDILRHTSYGIHGHAI